MKPVSSIVSIALIILTLLTSVRCTLNFHLCAGEVQSVAFYVKASQCDNSRCQSMHVMKTKGCCEDETFTFKGNDTNTEVKNFVQSVPSFIIITTDFTMLYSLAGLDPASFASDYMFYQPPLVRRDITLLVQSFLI